VLVRIELGFPGVFFGDSLLYKMLITSHGLVMIFFVMSVIIGGFGNWLVPLLMWIPDIAFEFLIVNSFYFFMLPSMLTSGGGVGAGWTVYSPLTKKCISMCVPMDFAIFSLHIAGLRSILGAINLLQL